MLWWLCPWLQWHWSVTGWKRLIYNTATSRVCMCVCVCVCVCVCEGGEEDRGTARESEFCFSCIYMRVTDRSVWIGVTIMCPHHWGYSCQLFVRWCCFYAHYTMSWSDIGEMQHAGWEGSFRRRAPQLSAYVGKQASVLGWIVMSRYQWGN